MTLHHAGAPALTPVLHPFPAYGCAGEYLVADEIGRDDRKREFEAKYSYAGKDGKNAAFTPCDPREPAQNVYKLNGVLEADKRNWIRATLFLSNEGKFELQYDYPKKEGEADVTPAAKPDPNYDPTKK